MENQNFFQIKIEQRVQELANGMYKTNIVEQFFTIPYGPFEEIKTKQEARRIAIKKTIGYLDESTTLHVTDNSATVVKSE